MTRPEYDTTTGAKLLYGHDGTNDQALLTDPEGHLINDDPTFKYKITDIDSAGDTKYFGYTDKDANWYIRQLTGTTSRYVKGSSGYTTAWTNRATQSYDYFYTIF